MAGTGSALFEWDMSEDGPHFSELLHNTRQEYPSVVPLQRFFPFSRLLTVTALVFKFITILLNRQWDYNSKAAIYLMRTVQRQEFSAEIEYLMEPIGRPMPGRVRDLFLDPDGLILPRGSIDQSSNLTYEVKNLILIGKHHPVTRLMSSSCHQTHYVGLPWKVLPCHERCYLAMKGVTLELGQPLRSLGGAVTGSRREDRPWISFWLLVPDVSVIIQHQWRRIRLLPCCRPVPISGSLINTPGSISLDIFGWVMGNENYKNVLAPIHMPEYLSSTYWVSFRHERAFFLSRPGSLH